MTTTLQNNPDSQTLKPTQVDPQAPSASQIKKVACIKLTLDVHAGKYQVVRQVGDLPLQPSQTFTPEGAIAFARKQLEQAQEVWCCYEAGPTGFWLQRRLEALGVHCIVAVPGNLDIYNRRINHDRSDARELAGRFSRFVAGEKTALATVRVPSVQAELRRAATRQRAQLAKLVRSLAAMGRSFALTQGFRLRGAWWRGKGWAHCQETLPAEVVEMLERYRPAILETHKSVQQLSQQIVEGQTQALPVGMGKQTYEVIEREVWDWDRFQNRKSPGAFAGLCGGISSSGEQHADLPITKHGSPRLRTILIELAWRMVRYQSQSRAVQRWKKVLLNPRCHARRRKQVIVALARQLLTDIWRWRTGRATPEVLGWSMAPAS